MKLLTIFIIILTLSSCMNDHTIINQDLDIQGHRGCRGDRPENTLIAFEYAILEHNVTTLELDLCISKDKKVVVSHEPFFNHEISTLNGQTITKEEEKEHNLYQMNYDSIIKYDVGTKGNARFPKQLKISAVKPLLSDVITMAEKLNPLIGYNIEIKRKESGDLVFHPKMEEFADMVIAELKELMILDRTYVQCFDIKTLQYIHETYPDIKLSLLIEYEKDLSKSLAALGFYPEAYSPYYKLLTQEALLFCKKNNIKVFPWTINSKEDIEATIKMGIDGIISDYPGRVNEVYQKLIKRK